MKDIVIQGQSNKDLREMLEINMQQMKEIANRIDEIEESLNLDKDKPNLIKNIKDMKKVMELGDLGSEMERLVIEAGLIVERTVTGDNNIIIKGK